jgi:hypothetical protein
MGGSVLLAGVESIAHGLALSYQPDRLEMWGQLTA